MKFIVVKAKSIVIALVMIAVTILLGISFGGERLASVYFGYSTRLVPIYCVDTDQKQVALSFDCAWGADKTEGIVKLLKENDIGATFFMVGFWVDDYPEMVKLINDNGIEIGTHSETHPDMAKLSAQQIREELTSSMQKIEAITRKKVTLFRPPFGSYNNTLIEQAQELKLQTIQWDVDTLDWKGLSGQQICDRVTKNVKNGSIILMHNNADNVLDGLKLTIDKLKNEGYNITCIGDLVYGENYTIDRNGVQHKT